MTNTDFGRLVQSFRDERRMAGNGHHWTREYLAQQTTANGHHLSVHQIRDIEKGNVALLRPELHIEPLATAFGLQGAAKAEFYAAAGYICQDDELPLDQGIIEQFLTQLAYPIAVFTPLGDIIAFNSYYAELYGYTGEALDALRYAEGIHANILRVYFEPVFRPLEVFCGKHKWREQAERGVRAFRVLSIRYVATRRYRQILEYMKSCLQFVRIWEICNNFEREGENLLVNPNVTLKHPDFPEMSFMKLHMPQPYLGSNNIVFGHLPICGSELVFQQFRETITDNRVYFFPLPDQR